MPTRVDVSRRLNSNSNFARAVKKAGTKKVKRAFDEVRDEVRQAVEDIIAAELVIDRSPSRRKRGNRRLAGSIDVVLDSTNTFPVTIRVTSKAPKAKVNALESGSRPHEIKPRNKDWLSFPSPRYTGYATEVGLRQSIIRFEGAGQRPSRRAREQAYLTRATTPEAFVKAQLVNHPGNRPYKFMERGLQIAVNKILQRASRN